MRPRRCSDYVAACAVCALRGSGYEQKPSGEAGKMIEVTDAMVAAFMRSWFGSDISLDDYLRVYRDLPRRAIAAALSAAPRQRPAAPIDPMSLRELPKQHGRPT
jgi:hypothetical protein